MLKWVTLLLFNSILFYGLSQNVIWSDDFSVPSNWTVTNTGQPISWDWNITSDQNLIPDAAPTLIPLETSTAGNGFALIDSRNQPGNQDGDGAIDAQITNAIPIDLSSFPNVILKFQHSYRWWHGSRGVRVSGDNGVTWTDFKLTDSTFYPVNRVSLNPEYESFNISSIAGGQSQVLIQFYYTDNDYKEWYWVVDDVEIVEQPMDDVSLIDCWCIALDNELEYGVEPDTHMDTSYVCGVKFINTGVNAQNNVRFEMNESNALVFASDSVSLVLPGDTIVLMDTISFPYLSLYDLTFEIESSADTIGGVADSNNVLSKLIEFQMSMWATFAQDHYGSYWGMQPVNFNESSIGTGNIEGGEEGLSLGVLYEFSEWWTTIVSVEVLLADGTVPGGEIFAAIYDSASYVNGDLSSPIAMSMFEVIDQNDVNAGKKSFGIWPWCYIQNESNLYVAVELYSNGGFSPIYIRDDHSTLRPEYSSMVVVPNDTVYKDGVCLGIRLLVDPEGLNENSLAGVNVFPNPTKGEVRISNEHSLNNHIIVTDLVGRLILETNAPAELTVDITSEKSGIYLFYIENEEGEMVRRVMLD